MAKKAPITIKNEEETLELLGRHNVDTELGSLKRHIREQMTINPKARMLIFLYLKEAPK